MRDKIKLYIIIYMTLYEFRKILDGRTVSLFIMPADLLEVGLVYIVWSKGVTRVVGLHAVDYLGSAFIANLCTMGFGQGLWVGPPTSIG